MNNEKQIVSKMIKIYCRHQHGNRFLVWYKPKNELCLDCEKLKVYAIHRLQNCKYGINKPTCSSCTTHCYSPEMQQKIKAVMRFSGPRMVFYHPIDAISYWIHKRKSVD